jgi:hypothetical protein
LSGLFYDPGYREVLHGLGRDTEIMHDMMLKPLLLSSSPCEIFSIQVPSDIERNIDAISRIGFIFLKHSGMCGFRSVSIDRLDAILANGIDVDPPEGVIYVAEPDKALEYGEWPKVVLALKWKHLDRPFRQIPRSSSKEEVELLQQKFPTMLTTEDGLMLHFSRLPREDRRVMGYEGDYGYWIPGNPWEALTAVFLLFRPEDETVFLKVRGKLK